MAEDTKGYITYGTEHRISSEKSKEYWKEASKSVAKQLGISVNDINSDEQYKHVFGVYKTIISNSKKNENVLTTLTKNYIIEGITISKGSNILLEANPNSIFKVIAIKDKKGSIEYDNLTWKEVYKKYKGKNVDMYLRVYNTNEFGNMVYDNKVREILIGNCEDLITEEDYYKAYDAII